MGPPREIRQQLFAPEKATISVSDDGYNPAAPSPPNASLLGAVAFPASEVPGSQRGIREWTQSRALGRDQTVH